MPVPLLCDCQTCCDIGSDNFDRADSDSLGASWSERSGDADISSNKLLFASTGMVRFETAHPDGASGGQYVTVDAVIAASTDYARVVVNYTDDNNYLYVSVEQVSSCWVLRLREVNGGVHGSIQDDQAITAFSSGVTFTFKVCWNPTTGILSARIEQLTSVWGSTSETTVSIADGSKVDLAGSTNTTFDNFVFKKLKSATLTLCPDCETPCFIGQDEFNRSDSTNLGCDWEEVSGTWEIVSNQLKNTGAGVGICKYKVFHPDAETGHYVSVDVTLPAGTPSITAKRHRVLVNYLDSNNYHWAEFFAQEPSGTQLVLKIGKVDAGTPTTLNTTSVTGSFGTYTMIVCWDAENDVLTASVQTPAQTIGLTASSTDIADGKFVALAAGTGTAGAEVFDNFQFYKHQRAEQATCPDCDEFSSGGNCDCCTTPSSQSAYTIDFGASFLTDQDCDACDTVADEYVLQQDTTFCQWIYRQRFCRVPNCVQTISFTILMNMITVGDSCMFRAVATIGTLFSLLSCGGIEVVYETGLFDPTECATLPKTMTKVSTSGFLDDVCAGTFPNSITLE